MGLIDGVFGGAKTAEALGEAAIGLSRVFHVDETRALELAHDGRAAALAAAGAEFAHAGTGGFDLFVNGLNRLPRPLLALGTLGLFIFAMAAPEAFAARMAGLAQVPEPLWWLLGAIVSFYFGARELHYRRAGAGAWVAVRPAPNPALDEWQAQHAHKDAR